MKSKSLILSVVHDFAKAFIDLAVVVTIAGCMLIIVIALVESVWFYFKVGM